MSKFVCHEKSRTKHLQWCKDRAMVYIKAGDLQQAFASFSSDMSKHSETSRHVALPLGNELFLAGHLGSKEKMKKWIQGFN